MAKSDSSKDATQVAPSYPRQSADDAEHYLDQAMALVELVRYQQEADKFIDTVVSSGLRIAGGTLPAMGDLGDDTVPNVLYLTYELLAKTQKCVRQLSDDVATKSSCGGAA